MQSRMFHDAVSGRATAPSVCMVFGPGVARWAIRPGSVCTHHPTRTVLFQFKKLDVHGASLTAGFRAPHPGIIARARCAPLVALLRHSSVAHAASLPYSHKDQVQPHSKRDRAASITSTVYDHPWLNLSSPICRSIGQSKSAAANRRYLGRSALPEGSPPTPTCPFSGAAPPWCEPWVREQH